MFVEEWVLSQWSCAWDPAGLSATAQAQGFFMQSIWGIPATTPRASLPATGPVGSTSRA